MLNAAKKGSNVSAPPTSFSRKARK